MPRDLRSLIFVGIKNTVIALDLKSGEEVWRAKLKGSDFVTVLFDGESLVAANAGEVFALDPRSGEILWHNVLKGLGLGLVSLASSRIATGSSTGVPSIAAAKAREQVAAAAG